MVHSSENPEDIHAHQRAVSRQAQEDQLNDDSRAATVSRQQQIAQNRALGQQRRRERERLQAPAVPPVASSSTPVSNRPAQPPRIAGDSAAGAVSRQQQIAQNRALGQQRRRERERLQAPALPPVAPTSRNPRILRSLSITPPPILSREELNEFARQNPPAFAPLPPPALRNPSIPRSPSITPPPILSREELNEFARQNPVFGPPRPPVARNAAIRPRSPSLTPPPLLLPQPVRVAVLPPAAPIPLLPPVPAQPAQILPEFPAPAEDVDEVETNEREGRRLDRVRRNRLFMSARQPYQDPLHRHDLGRMDVPCSHCGAMHWLDEKVSGSSRISPKFGMCCNHGKVKLDPLPDPPDVYRPFFTSMDPVYVKFRDEIWKYNRAFSFTSLGVREDHTVNGRGRGPPVFRISGELHHLSGALEPQDGQQPRYAQLYIIEPRAALESRQNQNATLDAGVMETLQQMLRNNHQYVPVYKHAFEVLQQYDPANDIEVRLRLTPGLDKRRYNLPTADEVAVLLPGNVEPRGRDIVLRLRQQNAYLDRISELHPAYTPLQYPLLFPLGSNGWHQAMVLEDAPHNRRRGDDEGDEGEDVGEEAGGRLTLCRHTAYRIMFRPDEFNLLLRGGRLFSRFIVDMFAALDQQRLRWILTHQSQFRTARLGNLEDANMNDPDNFTLDSIGKRIFLPSSYIGGPRNMGQCFQDSMAIARFYGKVDLFLTMTTNPNWPEIQRELLPGQTSYDRPDLVARVFRLKQKVVLDYVYKHGIFGVCVAHVHTIEFQKRGLPHMHCLIFLHPRNKLLTPEAIDPHMHCLIFLHPRNKLLTPEAIDSCISAKWPDPITQPLLFETVKTSMVHGPCGALNPRAVCMVNGKCSKGFPKPFVEGTRMTRSGYPEYDRPDDGRQYEVRGIMVDNRWIVAFSPSLLAELDCHINVECCISMNSVRYTFKYIQKGPDRGALEVIAEEQPGQEPAPRNEVKEFVDGRYISPPDAVWRLLQFPTHKNVPNVQRLQIHLPGQHNIVFRQTDDATAVIARGADKETTLTAFFKANADGGALGDLARTLTYQEFPQHMVFSKPQGKWKIRQQEFAIGRMYFIKPTAGAIFYLRTLLTVVKGATSFEDLRRVPDNPLPLATFYDACLAQGLLEDDGEWRICLLEAAAMQTGSRLRQLFATLLLFGEPARPATLWAEFWVDICSDLERRIIAMPAFQHEQQILPDRVQDYGLFLLDQILRRAGRSLSEWESMPQWHLDWATHTANPLIAEHLNYVRDEEMQNFERSYAVLNPGQRVALDTILTSVGQRQSRLFLLKGSAGTGKTFVYNAISARIRAEGLIVLCVSSSGISALLIRGGRTAHSMFKIPIDGLEEGSACHLSKGTDRVDLICQARALIWDEIGAQHRHAIEAVDKSLRDLRDDNRPFGGLTTVLGGDFLQTLPVVPGGSREDIVDACVQNSHLWAHVEILSLDQNMRLHGASNDMRMFAAWLLDLGNARNTLPDGNVFFDAAMRVVDEPSLIASTYPGLGGSVIPPPEYFTDRMILAPRNADVASLNQTILDMMPGDARQYFSADTVMDEAGVDAHNRPPVPAEVLRSITGSGLPPGELNVKIGCPVILLRNLNPALGLCNGTRLVITRMGNRVIEGKVLGGEHNGELAFIPRISIIPSEAIGDITFTFKRRQFPLQLAFSLTINKAQGQTVHHVGLDLRVPAFSHGQLYVALSRVTSPYNVRILLPDDQPLDSNCTQNVVYPEVLI